MNVGPLRMGGAHKAELYLGHECRIHTEVLTHVKHKIKISTSVQFPSSWCHETASSTNASDILQSKVCSTGGECGFRICVFTNKTSKTILELSGSH